MKSSSGVSERDGNPRLSRHILLICLCLCMGCKSGRTSGEPSAIVQTGWIVLLPLGIPVAAVYHGGRLASGTTVREVRNKRQLKAALDPVYQDRLKLLQERDPVAEADAAWARKVEVYLVHDPRMGFFPGFEGRQTPEFIARNREAAEQDERVKFLYYLVQTDPIHPTNPEMYISQHYFEFRTLAFDFTTKYNRRMLLNSSGGTP